MLSAPIFKNVSIFGKKTAIGDNLEPIFAEKCLSTQTWCEFALKKEEKNTLQETTPVLAPL